MNLETIDYLHDLHFITQEQREKLSRLYSKDVFSLHYELRCVMYIGVLLFIAGLSLFAYNNLKTFGHQLFIFMLFTMMSSCLSYAVAKGRRYSNTEVVSPGIVYDYMLFLGCLLFSLTLGYAQFKYALFDGGWELVGLVPALVFIPLAYRYDHRGVLSLGIVSLASAIGLTVSPVSLMRHGFIPNTELISVGLAYGALLVVIGLTSDYSNIKKHFKTSYIHSGAHFLFIACLAGLVSEDKKLVFLIVLSVLCGFGAFYAKRFHSFSILVIVSVYTYIGVSYLVSRVITDTTVQPIYIVISFLTVIVALLTFRKHLSTG